MVQALKFLFRFLLRRFRKVPLWVWIFIAGLTLNWPYVLGLLFRWKIEPPWVLAAIGIIGGIVGLSAYVFGFLFDRERLGRTDP